MSNQLNCLIIILDAFPGKRKASSKSHVLSGNNVQHNLSGQNVSVSMGSLAVAIHTFRSPYINTHFALCVCVCVRACVRECVCALLEGKKT